ncbi:MAG: bifunctional oligoribonuclease/PAP phosphatase NrnA, partial [Acidobacteriota bacterium]
STGCSNASKMKRNSPLLLIRDKILSSHRIAITSHLRPDGDSICTSLALAGMLELSGREVRVINHDPTPFPFSHLPDIRTITIGQIPPAGFDLVILLECASVNRSGQQHLDGYFKINIDHHFSNDSYADINWVDPTASAVGEMAFFLGEKAGLPITAEIAGHLYCAIVSDTGGFQFSNTSAKAFAVCHRLVKLGANPVETTEFLFNTNPPEKIKLLGQVLSTLRMNRRGTIAVITMFKKFLDALHLREIDTEDITTLARSIKGVEMVLFFKEMAKDTFRISIRSKGRAHAAAIAEHFGGGGHVHAAGFTVVGPYERLIREVPQKIEKLLKQGNIPSLKQRNPASQAKR